METKWLSPYSTSPFIELNLKSLKIFTSYTSTIKYNIATSKKSTSPKD
jgi:hypothetical protein